MIEPQIISFNCILKNKAGLVISSTYNRDVLTAIADNTAALLGLSKGLIGLNKGEVRTIEVSADQAYGFYDLTKIILFPRKKLLKFAQNLCVGEFVSLPSKCGKIRTYKIIALQSDVISLDENHPLAGQDLIFEIEALEVRPATSAEINAASNNISQQLLH